MKTMQSVLRCYAVILFSTSPWVGALLLAASLCHPVIGLTGLAGTLIAIGAARVTGFDRYAITDGRLIFNSTLSCLALGYWLPPGSPPLPVFGTLLVVTSLVALGATVVLNHATYVLCGGAARSIPFCLVAAALHWLAAQKGLPFANVTLTDSFPLPGVLEHWSRSVSSILFSGGALAGLLVTTGLLISSRINLLNGVLGFGMVSLTLHLLDYHAADGAWLHLNGILIAMALGGMSYVPGRAATALAVVAAGLCTALALALLYWLRLLDMPMLTLPFNITLLAITSALRWREAGREPRAVLHPGSSPEETYRADEIFRARHPEPHIPCLAPPFDGEWVVTQGFDGTQTHRGAWRHAMDFEIMGTNGEADRPASHRLEDFPSFDAPVMSPAEGRVVRIVDDIADNDIGGMNLAQNWGNSVVLEIAPMLFVQLSHFRKKGIKVREGDRVREGQLLGYLGNSGRSPVPHLHLQMQVSPEIGAPTIPFRLRHYRLLDEAGWKYQFSGLPMENAAISGARRARWMEESFAMIENTRTYHVFSQNGDTHETIRHELEATGAVCLTSLETKSRLRFVIAEGLIQPLTFEGSHDSMLSLLWLAGRTPLVALPGLEWKEAVDATALLSPIERGAYLLAAPYLAKKQPTVRGRIAAVDAKNKEFVVRWSFAKGSSLELAFTKNGIERGRCEMATRWMRFFPAEPLESPARPVKSPLPSGLPAMA